MRNVDKNLWTKIFIRVSFIVVERKKNVNLNFQWEND